jgi:1-acyl-sn-glycerol-3-phosphate acyltransferase
MLSFLSGPVRGSLSFLLIVINTLFWASFLFPVSFIKLIIPVGGFRKLCNVILDGIATNWIACNNLNLRLTNDIEWEVTGVDGLAMDEWYLVLSNHQSWSDILVLQKVFNRKIPFLKFFIKKELIWVPVLGLAWWALDFPFMKRYSKEFLEKNPHLKGKDLETTKKACEKFRSIPVSIMNFVEGTRFTSEKQAKQESPYTRLLKPRAAGIAIVTYAMGEQLSSVLDVTIAYPEGARDIWEFLCGKVRKVRVDVKTMPLDDELVGDYFEDPEFRERFHEWLNRLWADKDRRMERLLGPG